MANITFNIAKGRVVELYNRVKSADPTNCKFIAIAIASTGLEADSVLVDKDTVADVVSGTTDEATNTGYARKVLAAADLAALPAPNDTTDSYALDLPDFAIGSPTNTGTGAIAKLLIAYDNDSTAGTDANLVPLTLHDFAVTPDGSLVTATTTKFFDAG